MKTIHRMLAAASALAVAAPLAAQPPHGDHGGAQSRQGRNDDRSRTGDRQRVDQLRLQLDTGIARGTITRREATTLRIDLDALVRLERAYGRDGFSRSDRDTLLRRGAGLQRLIRRAESNGHRGAPPLPGQ